MRREPEQLCRYTFHVGNYGDGSGFDYENSARVAAIYMKQFGHALTGPAVFESATVREGHYRASTGPMFDVVFAAPCASNHRPPTLRESNDPEVPW